MIKVIAFDYNGVIAPFGAIKKWMDENLTEDDKRYILYKESTSKWDLGEISLDETYTVLSEVTGVPSEKLWETFFATQVLNHDVVELIKNLRKNYKVYLFSNHQADLLRKLIEMHGIGNLFDDIIASSDHKLIKPDPSFYQLLLEVTGHPKDEILFIDDLQENVDGGNKFGIKSILFTDTKELENHLKQLLT